MEAPEVIVAVIDTGVDCSESHIVRHLWANGSETPGNGLDDDNNGYIDDIHGWNFVEQSGDISDYRMTKEENSHGTTVASIIYSHNPRAVGVAPFPQIKIMPIKVLTSDDNVMDGGELSSVIKAIEYAENNGAQRLDL